MQFNRTLETLGLSKNEARVYQVLVSSGELASGELATKSGIHRRNVYDALNRLTEKGLVVEILQRYEHLYQAVDPKKLSEFLDEQRAELESVLPSLRELYSKKRDEQEVFIYRGIEGWKNYMRDILRVGEDFYCCGGKGAWMDERLFKFFPRFSSETKRLGIGFYHLFDDEVRAENHPILKHVGEHYKFLPKEYSTPCSFDTFGNHVNIVSSIKLGGLERDFSFTVIVNEQLAQSFRTWFNFMYQHLPARGVEA